MTKPAHGEQRNWKEVTEHGPNAEFKDATTGEVVFNGPLCSHTFTQSERYCRNCGWVTCKGVLGAILCHSCNGTW